MFVDPNLEASSAYYITSVIYQFRCQCDVDYVGRMSQSLEAQINQDIPANICKRKVNNLQMYVSVLVSVIAKHLIKRQ